MVCTDYTQWNGGTAVRVDAWLGSWLLTWFAEEGDEKETIRITGVCIFGRRGYAGPTLWDVGREHGVMVVMVLGCCWCVSSVVAGNGV